jgi:hypothetical protein
MIGHWLYDSVKFPRNQIRRRLRYHVVRTNLAKAIIKYKRKEMTAPTSSADLLNDDWTIVKATPHDESNDDFDFQVGLRARSYESTDKIFEEFDVPPQFLAYFKPNWFIWLYIKIKIKLSSDLLYTTNRPPQDCLYRLSRNFIPRTSRYPIITLGQLR